MKELVISYLVVACASMPQQLLQPIAIIPVAILRQESTMNGPAFSYNFEADNGISVQATGTPGSAGQSNIQGQYSYTSPEGIQVQILYVCDESGCRYDAPIYPWAPAAPAHVADPLRFGLRPVFASASASASYFGSASASASASASSFSSSSAIGRPTQGASGSMLASNPFFNGNFNNGFGNNRFGSAENSNEQFINQRLGNQGFTNNNQNNNNDIFGNQDFNNQGFINQEFDNIGNPNAFNPNVDVDSGITGGVSSSNGSPSSSPQSIGPPSSGSANSDPANVPFRNVISNLQRRHPEDPHPFGSNSRAPAGFGFQGGFAGQNPNSGI